MTYRGYFALNGSEIANTSRLAVHLGRTAPTQDAGFITPAGTTCTLVESVTYPGDYVIPDDWIEVEPGLFHPGNGARRYDRGLIEFSGECWGPPMVCEDTGCNLPTMVYDDSWPGILAFLGDVEYRPELSPWYTTRIPESAEFAGIMVVGVDGLGPTPIDRPVNPAIGHGSVAGPNRDAGRTIKFEALLVGCTHAGLEYGLFWLGCLLRDATVDTSSTLKFLQSSPTDSSADPSTLVRIANNVVLTKAPEVTEQYNSSGKSNRQANMYRVTWEMAALSPYVYMPSTEQAVIWDEIVTQPINWVHAAECGKPESCEPMPVLFSSTCVPEEVALVTTPPPVCGGCMPVNGIAKFSYRVPTMDHPFQCRDTAVTMVITNTGEDEITLKSFWRECGADVRCETEYWPAQINKLPGGATITLDGITGTYWAYYDDRARRTVGIVSTPTGAPWRPPLIDRRTCWEFVVQSAVTAEFDVTFTFADRAA